MKQELRKRAREVYRVSVGLPPFEDWLKQVEAIDVDLLPGGRVRMLPPDGEPVVELQWQRIVDDDGAKSLDVGGIHVSYSPPTMVPDVLTSPPLSIATYYAAFLLAIHEEPDPAVTTDQAAPRPASGKPLSTGFYKNLNREYDALVRAGSSAPLKELARRYGVKDGTVKMWRFRAKQFREEKS